MLIKSQFANVFENMQGMDSTMKFGDASMETFLKVQEKASEERLQKKVRKELKKESKKLEKIVKSSGLKKKEVKAALTGSLTKIAMGSPAEIKRTFGQDNAVVIEPDQNPTGICRLNSDGTTTPVEPGFLRGFLGATSEGDGSHVPSETPVLQARELKIEVIDDQVSTAGPQNVESSTEVTGTLALALMNAADGRKNQKHNRQHHERRNKTHASDE